jgi:hypothetical protein
MVLQHAAPMVLGKGKYIIPIAANKDELPRFVV